MTYVTSPTLSSAELTNITLSAAVRAGDSSSAMVQQSGPVSRSVATEAMGGGDVVHSDTLSYVMAIKGTFTTQRPSPPPTPPLWSATPTTNNPTCTYGVVTIVVDASTGHVTDFGLAYSLPDISVAGPVTTLVQSPR